MEPANHRSDDSPLDDSSNALLKMALMLLRLKRESDGKARIDEGVHQDVALPVYARELDDVGQAAAVCRFGVQDDEVHGRPLFSCPNRGKAVPPQKIHPFCLSLHVFSPRLAFMCHL